MAEYSAQVEFIDVVGFRSDASRVILSNVADPDFAYYYLYLGGRLILDGRAVGIRQGDASFSGVVGTLVDASVPAPPTPAITAQVAFSGLVGTGVKNARRAIASNPDFSDYLSYPLSRLTLAGKAVGVKQGALPLTDVVGELNNAAGRSTKFTANAPIVGTTSPPVSGRVLARSTTPFAGTVGTLKDSALVKIAPGFIFTGTVGELTQGRISGYPGFSFTDIFDTPPNTRAGGHLTFNRRTTRNYAKQ